MFPMTASGVIEWLRHNMLEVAQEYDTFHPYDSSFDYYLDGAFDALEKELKDYIPKPNTEEFYKMMIDSLDDEGFKAFRYDVKYTKPLGELIHEGFVEYVIKTIDAEYHGMVQEIADEYDNDE